MKVLCAESTALPGCAEKVAALPGSLTFTPYRRAASELLSLVEGRGSVFTWLEPC